MDHTESTVNYYNDNSDKYITNTFELDLFSLYQPFLEYLQPNDRILDAGCGSGRDSLYFKNLGYQVTAIDASEEMVKFTASYAGVDVHLLRFDEIDFHNEFDAIWACASLLHVPMKDLEKSMNRLIESLSDNGIFYMSFKYGDAEVFRNDRIFTNFNEEKFNDFMKSFPSLEIERMWVTTDVRPNRDDEKWLNVIVRKVVTSLY